MKMRRKAAPEIRRRHAYGHTSHALPRRINLLLTTATISRQTA